jgi:zinc D-Ala-D-Ala carboxypeptidase
MKLTRNLSLAEVTKSGTAKRLGINNEPTPEHYKNLFVIAERVFQPIRDHFAKPLYVSSGYRSKALNEAIKGSSSSQHCKGEALDLDAQVYGGFTNKELFDYIRENLTFDQLIWEYGNDVEPDWVHVSYTHEGENRGEVLRVEKVDGLSQYRFI